MSDIDNDNNVNYIEDITRILMQIIVTIVILGISSYILINGQYSDDITKWCTFAIGAILGYWVR